MKIVNKKPWFWWIINIFSPNAKWGTVTLSLGDTIYTLKHPLSKGEIIHEQVHGRQDHHSKIIAILNAFRCLLDKKYYLRCEIEAYQAQNKVDYQPERYASYLSGPVYNNIISYEEALQYFK